MALPHAEVHLAVSIPPPHMNLLNYCLSHSVLKLRAFIQPLVRIAYLSIVAVRKHRWAFGRAGEIRTLARFITA